MGWNVPVIGINHLRGHLRSADLEEQRMHAVVEQPLGEVHGVDPQLLGLLLQRQDELVAGPTLRIGGVEAGLHQPLQQVVSYNFV